MGTINRDDYSENGIGEIVRSLASAVLAAGDEAPASPQLWSALSLCMCQCDDDAMEVRLAR